MDRRDYSRILNLVRAITANLVAIIGSRLELFAVEVQEEKARGVRLIMWLVAAVLAGGMAFLFLNLTIVYMTPENWRWAVLLGLTLFYLVAFTGIMLTVRRSLKRAAMPFAQSLEELKRDRECLRNED